MKKQCYYHVSDGTEIYLRRDLVENPKAVIVLVHGGSGHCLTYNEVTANLNSFGYSVYRYDQRTHGRSGGARGYLADYNMFLDDCREIVELAKSENPGLKLFTIGHSMGSMTTLGYGIKYPGQVDGQIFTGVACVCRDPETADLDMATDGFEEIPFDFSVLNKNSVDNYGADPWRLNMGLKGLHISLQRCMKYIESNIANEINPCLILHGENDIPAPVANAHFCYENISSADKTKKIYEGQPHGILKEASIKDVVIEDIHAWLDAHL